MAIDEKMKAILQLLKENDVVPNFSELARQSGIDYRTIKRYYNGYEGKPKTRNKPSKLDGHRDLIQKKLEIERVSIKGVYECSQILIHHLKWWSKRSGSDTQSNKNPMINVGL
jgi:hypothetical protein